MLAYAHPAWMLASLGVVLLALRIGLQMRRARRRRLRRPRGARRRHLRLARPGVVMLLIGFAGGPLSMAWLRGRDPFDTAHALAGSVAIALFSAAAVVGHRIERGRSRALELHALLGLLAVLVAAAAAATGFVLLP